MSFLLFMKEKKRAVVYGSPTYYPSSCIVLTKSQSNEKDRWQGILGALYSMGKTLSGKKIGKVGIA